MPGAGSIAGRMAEALANKALAGAPPEFFLVAACCRWPPCEARSQAIRAATQADCDWPRTLRIVQRHLVWGLAQDGIARAGIQPPAEIAENLRARAAALARRNLALAGETVRLQRRFDEADVPIIFLKGSSVAALAYGDLSLKHSLDIDILVAPARVAAAQLVLEKAGYALANPLPALTAQQFALLMRYSREWAFLARDRDMLVELHWKPSYNALLLKDIGPQSPLQQVRIGQAQIRTFRFEELFIYLCVHGAQHGWARLKWLADLAALLSARGERDIETLYRAAQTVGAGRCAGQALLLCQRLLALELPAFLAAELRGSARLAMLEALALDVMLGGGAQTEIYARVGGTLRVSLSMFLLGQSWRYVFDELRRYLISPADVAALVLPSSLSWVYPILRLPMWAWRRLGGTGDAAQP